LKAKIDCEGCMKRECAYFETFTKTCNFFLKEGRPRSRKLNKAGICLDYRAKSFIRKTRPSGSNSTTVIEILDEN
jgi:hypothetical protein